MTALSLRDHAWQSLTGQAESRQPLLPAVLLALAVHGAVVAALLFIPAVPAPPAGETVLQASWIAAPVKSTEEKHEPQSIPRRVIKPLPRTKTPPPLLTAKTAAPPSPMVPALMPPVAPPPSPASITPQAPTDLAADSSTNLVTKGTQTRNTAAPNITEPQFNADYLSNPPPEYPRISREMKEQGVVQLRVFVGPDGHPQEMLLYRSSGFDRLDQAALTAVRQWRFVPAKRGNEALAAWVIVPINFSLRKPS